MTRLVFLCLIALLVLSCVNVNATSIQQRMEKLQEVAEQQAESHSEDPSSAFLSLKEPAAAADHTTPEPVSTMTSAAATTDVTSTSIPTPTALVATETSSSSSSSSCIGKPSCDANGPLGRLATIRAAKSKDKLEVALQAIKQDILVRNRQIQDEKQWVAQVRKIVEQYNKKVKRVLADIEKTKQEVKVLFRKKKQIENLKIQRELEKKLKDASSDLATLKSALAHVKTKASEFAKTKNEIKKTIISIHTQLAKLKGEKDPKKLRAIAKQLNQE